MRPRVRRPHRRKKVVQTFRAVVQVKTPHTLPQSLSEESALTLSLNNAPPPATMPQIIAQPPPPSPPRPESEDDESELEDEGHGYIHIQRGHMDQTDLLSTLSQEESSYYWDVALQRQQKQQQQKQRQQQKHSQMSKRKNQSHHHHRHYPSQQHTMAQVMQPTAPTTPIEMARQHSLVDETSSTASSVARNNKQYRPPPPPNHDPVMRRRMTQQQYDKWQSSVPKQSQRPPPQHYNYHTNHPAGIHNRNWYHPKPSPIHEEEEDEDDEQEEYEAHFATPYPVDQLPTTTRRRRRRMPNMGHGLPQQPSPVIPNHNQARLQPRLKSPPPPPQRMQRPNDDVSSSFLGMWSKFFPPTPQPQAQTQHPVVTNQWQQQQQQRRPNTMTNTTTTTMLPQPLSPQQLHQQQLHIDTMTPWTSTATNPMTREAAWADDVQSSRTDKRILEPPGFGNSPQYAAGPLLNLPAPPPPPSGQLSPNTRIKEKISKKWKARRRAMAQQQQQHVWNTTAHEDWCREHENHDWPGEAYNANDDENMNTTAATAPPPSSCCYCCMG